MSSIMTRAEAETFLAEVRIGVLSINEPGRGALTVPLWYDYEIGGELFFVTEGDSRKAKLLAEGQRVSLCVQDEATPYRYVSVEGPVQSISPANTEEHFRPLAHRYLGVEGGDRYIEMDTDDAEDSQSIVVRVQPERWLSADYSKISIGL
jgi:PPOX class probable F420-dependent enzyme